MEYKCLLWLWSDGGGMFEILLSNGFPSHNIPPNAYRQLRLGILSTTKPDLFKPQPSVRRDKSGSKNDLGSCAGADQVYLHKDGFSTSRSEIKQLEARNASNQSIAHLQFVFTHFEQFNVSVGPLNLSPQVPISHRPRFGWCWVLLLWGR